MLVFSKALIVSRALRVNWLPESMLEREDLLLPPVWEMVRVLVVAMGSVRKER